MRTLAFAIFAAATLALSACAGMGDHASSGPSTEAARIRQECEAKGGTVVAPSRITNEPALDNPCRIPGAEPSSPRN